MPELPDVAAFQRTIDREVRGRRVRSARVTDRRILRGASAADVRETLERGQLSSTRRHGKLLFVRGRGGRWLGLHFGMTGFPRVVDDPAELDSHDRLVLELTDDRLFAFNCQRLFGEVSTCEDPDALIEQRQLGPDALALDLPAFRERIRGHRRPIKSVLMDQKVLAGIGNVYSDEILFNAKLDPGARADQLTDAELKRLHGQMRRVLERSIEAGAQPERMPRTWLTPHRGPGGRCPRCDAKLQRFDMGGRRGWRCPRCQSSRSGGG